MMYLPDVKVCAICDQVRMEATKKLQLLGLFGFAPDVRVLVREFPAQIDLTFLTAFHRPTQSGEVVLTARILNPDGAEMVSWPPGPMKFAEAKAPFLVHAVRMLRVQEPGTLRYQLVDSDDNERYATEFALEPGAEDIFQGGLA